MYVYIYTYIYIYVYRYTRAPSQFVAKRVWGVGIRVLGVVFTRFWAWLVFRVQGLL